MVRHISIGPLLRGAITPEPRRFSIERRSVWRQTLLTSRQGNRGSSENEPSRVVRLIISSTPELHRWGERRDRDHNNAGYAGKNPRLARAVFVADYAALTSSLTFCLTNYLDAIRTAL